MKYLITGGTGTLGTALVNRLLADKSTTAIRVYARSEERHEQLMRRFPDDAKPGGRIRNIVGDVRDRQHLLEAAKDIDIIIHAAAVKRVDLVEYNAADSVEINVTGTLNALRAASQSTCKTFVLISSDKGCEPMQTYGRTKAMAESLTTTANHWLGDGQTAYYGIRYGNVINSNGSIIQKIAEWKSKKVPALITHKDMTRFWFTIEDAVDIVMTAIAARDYGIQSGSMLIPKLKSLAVVDVITALYPEGSIKIMGIRPGEKMHESLLGHDEAAGRVGMWRTKRDKGLPSMYDTIVMAPKIGLHFNKPENGPVDWDWHGRGLYSDTELDESNELIAVIKRAAGDSG